MLVSPAWRWSLTAAAFVVAFAGGESAHAQSAAILFRGSYVCGQGPTAVEIMLPDLRNGTQGEFRFGGGQVPRGRFTFTLLSKTGDDFLLQPLRWIEQPRGYTMVGADVTIRGGRLQGQITARVCGKISATEVSVQGTRSYETTEATSPAPLAITKQLKEVLRQDALWWYANKLDVGSASEASRISGQDGIDYRVRYTFNGGRAGWMVGRYDQSGKLQCVIFHDYWGDCRAPRSEATYLAQKRDAEAAEKRRAAQQVAIDRAAGVHVDKGLKYSKMEGRYKPSPSNCLFTAAAGRDRETAELRDEYGNVETIGSYTRRTYDVVKNICKTTATYVREGESHSIGAGSLQRWICYYNRGETALGGINSTLWGCSKQ